jgi:hypothetical protein
MCVLGEWIRLNLDACFISYSLLFPNFGGNLQPIRPPGVLSFVLQTVDQSGVRDVVVGPRDAQ